jgi:hypothetical protein
MSTWRDRLLGSRSSLGWWTLPVFVATALGGAVLAGTLATVYYAQQIEALEQETRDARLTAERAAEEVAEAREEALAEIEDQVAGVREALTRTFPFDDVTAAGVVSIRALVGSEPPPPPAPAADDDADGALPTVLGQTEDGAGQTEQPQPPPPTEQPSPTPRPVTDRFGSGFAVAVEDGVAFFATTFGVVADPEAPDGVVGRVEVRTATATVAGTVHSWDAGRDLAVVRAPLPDVTVTLWRPTSVPLSLGQRVVVAGVTPGLEPVQAAGQLALVSDRALVTDLPPFPYLRGAPIVDVNGLVVGVFSGDYQPFGSAAGERQASIPVQLLCTSLLRSCESLQADPSSLAEDG